MSPLVFTSCLLSTWVLCSIVAFAEMDESAQELRLLDHLLKNYKTRRLIRPVKDRSKPVVIGFSAELIGVAKVDEKEQIIKTHFWIRLDWNNPYMTWKPEEYGGNKVMNIPPEMLWVPDIILYNNADDRLSLKATSGFTTSVKVRHDGNQTWRAHIIYKSMCNINVKYFPFDEQQCKMVFASWSHDVSTIDLRKRKGLPGGKAVAKKDRGSDVFQENEEWTVEWITIERHEKENDCCDLPVADLTVTMLLRRRTYYYVMSLILPCTLIACTIFLEFILPAESGERVGLGITILLSMAVFQELTSEKLPSSSEHFPLLAMYYSVSIMEIGTALGATCIILNFHHRNTKMPNWFQKIVLEWLAKIVRYELTCNRHLTNGEALNDSTQKVMQSNTNSDRKRNDAFDLERESIEYEMDLYEESRAGRDQVPLAQNGNIATNHVVRKRSVKCKPQDSETDATEVQISEAKFPLYDFNREEFYKKQWQDAARILDRFLLLASIVIGSVSALSIFLQSPRIRELFIP
ncbi:neuronal acetylcholine receptor subunit alpha-7-like isoform X2 [Stylophora pistillata]|uniref:Neuronal acetylcholine receptor subunit alpha-7 n=1 Tax=Stylophora pistillata TaxID=50429 RepID=A0A2B4RJ16_STYPI|nr:neuronal acetylcholine receptor subunit alpha-7-like isoform X2 [Stylophora pistillata]PFX16347.1 Neuronal acetylcholine receptor subunit alpha-7 [Stylophora pistillata]